MRRPRTLGVGWLLMLITTLLMCISGLHWAHVTTMNTSIDHIIEETFDTVMHDLAHGPPARPGRRVELVVSEDGGRIAPR